jgi:hypothetical protein
MIFDMIAIGNEVDLNLSISQPNTGTPKMDQNSTGSQLQYGPKANDFLYLLFLEKKIFPLKFSILRFVKCIDLVVMCLKNEES